jgi:hypothetical protein
MQVPGALVSFYMREEKEEQISILSIFIKFISNVHDCVGYYHGNIEKFRVIR